MKRLLVVALIAVGLISGCGPTPPPPIAVTLSPSAAQAIDEGQALSISATVANDSLAKGVTWTVTGGGTLSATTGSPVTYTAPTSGSANITATVTATSVADATKAASVNIVVSPPPAISAQTLANGIVGVAYNQTIAETGGAGALTYSNNGSLPAGLHLNGSTGAITGTPTATGTSSFTVTVTDSSVGLAGTIGAGHQSATSPSLSITVNQAPAIISGNSTAFTAGVAGSFTVTATAVPTASLTESGTLPAGVTFVDNGNNSGTLSGTAGATGTFPITFTASNGVGTNATQNFTLTIGQAPAITSAASTTFTVGQAGTFTVTTTGFPLPALTETGALPTGVTFVDNGNGTATLAGTPAALTGGTYSLSIKAHNGIGTDATQTFTLTVDQVAAITSAASTTFTVGQAGTFTVTTTGTPKPSITETGALPTGVTLVDNGNGTAALSGTPGAGTAGSYPITLTAHNGVGTDATQIFTLTVNTAPVITSANSTTFTVGQAGTFTVTTTGTPTPTITETGVLPTGVTLVDNGNGTATLAGTPGPGTSGTFQITIKAHNGIGTDATQTFTLTVNQAPAITSANSITFTVGTAGSFTVTTTGTPTPSIAESGTLPSTVTFTDNGNGTGTLSGTPGSADAGSYPITFTASNGVGSNATQDFTLTITIPLLVISPASGALPSGTVNTAYSTTISATGGVSPYTFTLDGSSNPLPPGLGPITSAGVISGTPTTAGTYPGIIVDVTDSETSPVTKKATYSITVNAASAACGSGHESVLSGNYAFMLQGWDANGAVARGGTFFADGTGHLTGTGGVEDINRAGNSSGTGRSVSNPAINAASSSYSVGADNRGCLTLASTGGFTTQFRFALGGISGGVASTGRMIEFDDTTGTGTRVSGPIRQQTSSAFTTASISGHYTFGLSGVDESGTRQASAGYILFGGSGTITGGNYDADDNGSLDTNQPFTPGTSYNVANNGRGTMAVTTIHGTSNMIFYVINNADVLLMSGDAINVSPLQSGEGVKATITTFSNSSLSGTAVFYITDLDNSSSPPATEVQLGLASATSGTVTVKIYDKDGSAALTSQTMTLTYSVASNGRVTLTGGGGGNPVFYLSGQNQSFFVGTDNGATSGTMENQTSTSSFTAGTFFGGTVNPATNQGGETIVAGTADGAGNVTGTDDNSNGSGLTANETFTGTYSFISDGTGTLSVTSSSGGDTLTTIMISPTKFVGISQTENHPRVMIFQR